MDTALGSVAPSVFSTDGPTVRCPPSLNWVPSGQVPLLHRYYEGTTTSRHHLAPLRFLRAGNTNLQPTSNSVRSCECTDAPTRRPGISADNPFRFLKAWSQRDLPGSWMTLRTSALFSDPGRADVSGHFGTSVLPPLKPQRRPRQFKPFEAQSHGFCARLLRFVQGSPQCYARMAPGCRPALPGGLGFPLGHDRRFRSAIASHLPSPGFSWRQIFFRISRTISAA